jgi:hypothetical protein
MTEPANSYETTELMTQHGFSVSFRGFKTDVLLNVSFILCNLNHIRSDQEEKSR